MTDARILSPYIVETSATDASYNLHIVYAIGDERSEEMEALAKELHKVITYSVSEEEDIVEVSQNSTEIDFADEKNVPAQSIHIMSNDRRDLTQALKTVIEEGFKLDKAFEELEAQIDALKIVPKFMIRFFENKNKFMPDAKLEGFIIRLTCNIKYGADYEQDVEDMAKAMCNSEAAKKAAQHGFQFKLDLPMQVSDGNNYHYVTITAKSANGMTAVLTDLQREFGITYDRGMQEIFFDARKVENSFLAAQR